MPESGVSQTRAPKAAVRYRDGRVPRHVSNPAGWLPAYRVAEILEDVIARAEKAAEGLTHGRAAIQPCANMGHGEKTVGAAGVRDTIAEQAGVSVRWLYRITSGESESVAFDKVDAVFVSLGIVHVFHLPPEQGGLSDLYFHPDVVGEDDADELRGIAEDLAELREAA